eukprot:SM000104S09319  [mRNA]  locus=s104:29630:30918:+ [translate_table: standard]
MPPALARQAAALASWRLAPLPLPSPPAAARAVVRCATGRGPADVVGDVGPEKSKNQRKREAQRSRGWGERLVELSPRELQLVASWAELPDEVVDAVQLARSIGRGGKNGWRRQLGFVGGLLRDADPALMEASMKAARDGGLGGFRPPKLQGSGGQQDQLAAALDDKVREDEDEDLKNKG